MHTTLNLSRVAVSSISSHGEREHYKVIVFNKSGNMRQHAEEKYS